MRVMSLLASVLVLLILGLPRAGSAQAAQGTIVDFVLEHAEELALSPAQVQALEGLDADLARELIRRQAELALAYVNLGALMDGDPTRTVDVTRAEGRVRDVERGRSELQLVLVRGTETVKAQLTPEQRTKLTALLTPASAPSGGGHPGGHPSHGSPGHGPSHHGHFHPHVWIGSPLWWDPFWPYPPAPPVVVEPPAYVQQAPAYWYYCASLRAYYPYVTTCPEAWVPVPAQ